MIDPNADILNRFGPPGYKAVTVPTQGNVGKGVLRGPGTNNWDISIYRVLRLRERVNGVMADAGT